MPNTTLIAWITFFLGIQLGALPLFESIRVWVWLSGVIGITIMMLLVLFTKEK